MSNNDRPLHENNYTRSFSPSGQETPEVDKMKFNNLPIGFWAKERENAPPPEDTKPVNKA
jgi:hypothetical protein